MVYISIIRIPIKGGMTIPNIATFDHGTYTCIFVLISFNYAFITATAELSDHVSIIFNYCTWAPPEVSLLSQNLNDPKPLLL